MPVTRRQFLGSALLAGALLSPADAPSAQPPDSDIAPLPEVAAGGPIRPPGAVAETQFRGRCISCGVCVNTCRVKKFHAISVSSTTGQRSDFGTPQVADMRDFPCTLCMECPPRCPTGALRKVAKDDVAMGMALIDTRVCFGWNGDVCLSCSKVCPLGARVFDFHYGPWGNQPYINDKCVGCGLCVKYCVLGGSAIKVITREKYAEIRQSYLKNLEETLEMDVPQRYALVYERNMPRILARGKLVEREYR